LHPFCENCLSIPQLALLPPSEPIHFPRRDQKVERRIHTKVHLELGEEDPDQVHGAVVDFGCKGIIIELLIKEVLFLSQIMVY
jgi:hypothetical protein